MNVVDWVFPMECIKFVHDANNIKFCKVSKKKHTTYYWMNGLYKYVLIPKPSVVFISKYTKKKKIPTRMINEPCHSLISDHIARSIIAPKPSFVKQLKLFIVVWSI